MQVRDTREKRANLINKTLQNLKFVFNMPM